jgi:hydrogenase/urease accessory protein HupE
MIAFSSSWFVKGLSHPAMTPSHIILILALGLLLGQQAKSGLPGRLAVLIISLVIGFILNHYLSDSVKNLFNTELILLLLALSIGLLTLLKLELNNALLMPVVLMTGVMLGLDSTPAMIPGLRSVSINSWLMGAGSGIVALVTLICLTSLLLRNVLKGLILRILASWIATSAIFVLTLMLAKH